MLFFRKEKDLNGISEILRDALVPMVPEHSGEGKGQALFSLVSVSWAASVWGLQVKVAPQATRVEPSPRPLIVTLQPLWCQEVELPVQCGQRQNIMASSLILRLTTNKFALLSCVMACNNSSLLITFRPFGKAQDILCCYFIALWKHITCLVSQVNHRRGTMSQNELYS